jgi:hypothetical protein
MTDDLVCPICKQKAKPLADTVLTIGFDCPNPKHGKYHVSTTVKATAAHWNASEERWEKALKRAKEREPGGAIPIINDDDFDDYG